MLTIPELLAARRPPFQFVHCEHCRTELRAHAPIVVATRNCPACGTPAVAEPTPDATPELITAEQLDAAHELYARATNRGRWVACLGLLGWLVIVAGVVLYRDTIDDALRPFADPSWVLLPVLLPLVVSVLAAYLVVARAERAGLKCPHCAAMLHRFWPVVRLTGNCHACGRRVLTDEPPDEPTEPARTIAEFQSALARFKRFGLFASVGLWVAFTAVPIVFAVVAGQFNQFWQPIEDRHGAVWAAVAVSGAITAVVLGAAGVVILSTRWVLRLLEKRQAADPLLNCPHCQAALSPSRLVIANRRCPKCRVRVLADPEPIGVTNEG